MSLPEHFWLKVDKSAGLNGCWLWTAGKTEKGYGRSKIEGKEKRAHTRVLEEKLGRSVQVGRETLHSCDSPSCVNPSHLSEGTHLQNEQDKDAKGRRRVVRGEKHYRAKLTEADVIACRYAYCMFGVTQKLLGSRYGVQQPAMGRIIHGKRWSHVGCGSASQTATTLENQSISLLQS